MKTLKLTTTPLWQSKVLVHFIYCALALLLGWFYLPTILQSFNPTIGQLDNGIWLLFLFGMSCFLLVFGISLSLFTWLLKHYALPDFSGMVLQFKHLTLWQQFVGYWASFALLFLGALLSLAAIF